METVFSKFGIQCFEEAFGHVIPEVSFPVHAHCTSRFEWKLNRKRIDGPVLGKPSGGRSGAIGCLTIIEYIEQRRTF